MLISQRHFDGPVLEPLPGLFHGLPHKYPKIHGPRDYCPPCPPLGGPAFAVCGRQVGRWQLDSKTERSLRCLLAKATWWIKCNSNNLRDNWKKQLDKHKVGGMIKEKFMNLWGILYSALHIHRWFSALYNIETTQGRFIASSAARSGGGLLLPHWPVYQNAE